METPSTGSGHPSSASGRHSDSPSESGSGQAPATEGRQAATGDLATMILGLALLLSMATALYGAFLYAPTERVQGDVQRIFYFHAPVAWVGALAFFVVFVSSILYLWHNQERWDVLARSSAEIGVVFTTLVIITGSLWGKPIWGTWWTWSPRLTTTLILWFIYVAYLMLRAYAPEGAAPRYAAVLGIIGFVDVPIVFLAVLWWRELHPGYVVVQEGGMGMPPQMFITLMVSLLAFTLLYVYLLVQRLRLDGLEEEVKGLRENQ